MFSSFLFVQSGIMAVRTKRHMLLELLQWPKGEMGECRRQGEREKGTQEGQEGEG